MTLSKKQSLLVRDYTKVIVNFSMYTADTYDQLHKLVRYVCEKFQARPLKLSDANDVAPCFWSMVHHDNESVSIELYFADPSNALLFSLSR